MNPLLINILLALAWGLMTTNMSAGNLVIGFIIGFFILFLQQRQRIGRSSYFVKAVQFGSFSLYFVKEMIQSSLRVAYDAITPKLRAKPAILAVQLDMKTDAEIALLANVVSLTPGTLSLDLSPDRKTLYVHAMYAEDGDAVCKSIKEDMERPLLELLR
jgi:multicomponent Na+:H+ antiporter subunit E